MVTSNTVAYLSLLRKCRGELDRKVSSSEKGFLKGFHEWPCSTPPSTGEVHICPAEWKEQIEL